LGGLNPIIIFFLILLRPIEIPFNNYFAYQNLATNMGQTTLFNMASQSIDRLWGTARLQAYKNGNNPPKAVGIAEDRELNIIKTTPSYFTYKGDTGTHYQF
jgi:hypothetical protein